MLHVLHKRIEIDVAVSQMTQADAVADTEWLDCWLNFCHLWNETEKLIACHLDPFFVASTAPASIGEASSDTEVTETWRRGFCGAVVGNTLSTSLLEVPSVFLTQ